MLFNFPLLKDKTVILELNLEVRVCWFFSCKIATLKMGLFAFCVAAVFSYFQRETAVSLGSGWSSGSPLPRA